MKALVLENNGILFYKDVPMPGPKPDECLIAVKFAGICNSDIQRAYHNGAYFYPLIMGHEFSGVVKEAGVDVKNYKKGDRVAVFPLIPCRKCEFCETGDYAQCRSYDYYGSRRDGAFAEFVAVKEWNLFKIPDDLELKVGALMEPVSVAIHAVRKLSLRADDSFAVFGAGIIGLAIVKYLSTVVDRQNIYLIDRNDFKLSIAADWGVKTVNSKVRENWLEELMKDTGGVNHSIEACGAVETFKRSLEIVKSHGDVCWLGNIHGDMTLDKKTVSSILRREINIFGCWNSRFNHNADDDWNYASSFMKNFGEIDKLVSHNVLEDGNSIFEKLCSNKAERGIRDNFLKIMFHL